MTVRSKARISHLCFFMLSLLSAGNPKYQLTVWKILNLHRVGVGLIVHQIKLDTPHAASYIIHMDVTYPAIIKSGHNRHK